MEFRRKILRQGLDLAASAGVEIGPLNRPIVRKDEGKITYIDYTNTASLRNAYKDDPNVDVDEIVEVDEIWGGRNLLELLHNRQVDYILASHVAEHVPNLLGWLAEMQAALKPSGQLRLVLPDKRFSFDVLRTETTFADLGAAYLIDARRPQIRDVLDFRLNFAPECDGAGIYEGRVSADDARPFHTVEVAFGAATQARDHPDVYFDVHCLVATPRTFGRLLEQAARLKLLRLACAKFIDTSPEHGFEFYVFAEPCDDPDRVAASWRDMAEAASDPLPGSLAAPSARGELAEQLRRTRSELEALNSELSEARARAERGEAQLAGTAARLRAIESSTTWRITGPLRGAVGALKGR